MIPCLAAALASSVVAIAPPDEGAGSAAADPASASAPATDADSSFRLSFSADAWFPRLEGEFTDGPANVDVRSPDLHGSEVAFSGELALTRDRLKVALRGFSFDTAGADAAPEAFNLGGLAVAAGDVVDTSFSWWSAGARVSYDFFRPLAEQSTPWSAPKAGWTKPANNTDLSVFALVSIDVEAMRRSILNVTSGLATNANETFAVVGAGGGFRLSFDTKQRVPVIRGIELSAAITAETVLPMGDGDLGFGMRIETELSVRFCPQGCAYLGYRYAGGGYEGEDMALRGSLQGIRGGVRLEF